MSDTLIHTIYSGTPSFHLMLYILLQDCKIWRPQSLRAYTDHYSLAKTLRFTAKPEIQGEFFAWYSHRQIHLDPTVQVIYRLPWNGKGDKTNHSVVSGVLSSTFKDFSVFLTFLAFSLWMSSCLVPVWSSPVNNAAMRSWKTPKPFQSFAVLHWLTWSIIAVHELRLLSCTTRFSARTETWINYFQMHWMNRCQVSFTDLNNNTLSGWRHDKHILGAMLPNAFARRFLCIWAGKWLKLPLGDIGPVNEPI